MATLEGTRPGQPEHVMGAGAERRRRSLRPIVLYPLTIVLALLFLFPTFYSVGDALKTAKEMYLFPPILFPPDPQFANFVVAFTTFPFIVWYRNTFEVVILNTAGVVITSTLVAYGFARFNF